jgi:ABC-2 type transport system permease protein
VAFWLASVLVAPRIGAAVAESLQPSPEATQFWQAIHHDIQNGLDNDGNAKAREAAFKQQVLQQYGVERPEDLPLGYTALLRHFNDEYASKVHDLHFGKLRDSFQQQQALSHLASCLGPTIAMRSLSMTLAGMDLRHQYHFDDAAEQYRHYFIGLTDDWDRQRSQGTQRNAEGDNLDWHSVEAFNYSPPNWQFALTTAWLDLVVLAAWLAAALSLLILAARRLKP